MASRAGSLGTSPWWPTSELGTPIWSNGSYTHEQLKNGSHRPPDGPDDQSASVIVHPPALTCLHQSLGEMVY